jgi:aspartate/methionine/tyrosine aminotransferase
VRPVKHGNRGLSAYGTTIFEVMSRLAREHGAINLGQGFPDGNGPDDVRAAAARALEDRPNQYPPMLGLLELREAVAAHARRFYGLEVDGEREVMVTSGATEALAACLFGLLEPGDEAVLFEPLYDSYLPIVERAGAVGRRVRIEPPDWRLDREALAGAFSDRTKLIVVNSPMNPTGKVFSREELGAIAELVAAHDTFAVCDEVYEHLVFDGARHHPLIGLPGMRERAARIGSAGKTFSLTGWKVGYVTAAPEMLAPIARAHQFLTFTTPPNLQLAAAYGLGKGDDYFTDLAARLQAGRDRLRAGLERLGFAVASCQGTYFLTADIRSIGYTGSDLEFCKQITREARVAAIPYSAFYVDRPPEGQVRFAFCKPPAILDDAIERLGAWLARR